MFKVEISCANGDSWNSRYNNECVETGLGLLKPGRIVVVTGNTLGRVIAHERTHSELIGSTCRVRKAINQLEIMPVTRRESNE